MMGVVSGAGGMGGVVHDGIVKGLGTEVSGAALTVALDVVQAWAVVLTLGFTIILFFFLAFCVCSKKDDSYDEYDDYEGVRTVRVYHHPHDSSENGLLTDQTSQASSRCTLKRELPAIPSTGTTTISQQQIKKSSDGQATTQQLQLQQGASTGPCRPVGGVQVLPSTAAAPLVGTKSMGGGGGSRNSHSPPPSEVGPSTSSTVSSELVTRHTSHSSFGSGPPKEHQYAHLKPTKEEHPYAKVGGEYETDTDNYDDPRTVSASQRLRSEQLQKSHYESVLSPVATVCESGALYPPSLGSAAATQPRSPSLDIQASAAIAGHTPANEELPYMTPKMMQPGATATTTISSSAAARAQQTSQQQTPSCTAAPTVGLSQLGEGFAAITEQHPQGRSPVGESQQGQQHFSGDSQDSRGYTSISVREPLSALKAGQQQQPSALPPHMQHQEGYYMTVSDDSADETYACIYERGSTQTYAQIQPLSATSSVSPPPATSQPPPPSHLPLSSPSSSLPPTSGGVSSPSPLPELGSPDPPAPPSVDSLKHVLHSRQASSGSTSGVGPVSSPGCEKRGGASIVGVAGSRSSPLPPLPQGDQNYYETAPPPPPPPPSATSPPHSGPGSPHKTPVASAPHSPPLIGGERPTQRALEEMYAKVMKKRGSTGGGHSRGNSSEAAESLHQSLENSAEIAEVQMQQRVTWNIVGVVGGQPPHSTITPHSTQHTSDPGYETVKDYSEQNYPAYETVRNGRENESEPGYETVSGGKKIEEDLSEPGYETVANRSSLSEAAEPGYETVKGGARTSYAEPGYETVSSRHEQSSDPGYETVSSRQDDIQPEPGYEQVLMGSRRPPSECDSNYEQLKFTEQPDPGYESVGGSERNYVSVCDVETQQMSDNSPMYAEIKKQVKPQPVYASVKKKSPEEKMISFENKSPLGGDKVEAEQPKGYQNGDGILEVSELPEKKYRLSIEEEAAILVNTVEESAINILTSREKSIDNIMRLSEGLNADGEVNEVTSTIPDGGALPVATSDGSDTSSDAVFSRQTTQDAPVTLPGLVSVAPGDVSRDDVCSLGKKDSGSVETDNTRDTNKASIEVHSGSAHSSVDNSSSGREDISPEDEVSLPPPGGTMDDSEPDAVGGTHNSGITTADSVESEVTEGDSKSPTVLSIPVPQSFYVSAVTNAGGSVTAAPVSPPHACLLLDTDLPEQDQLVPLPPPPPPPTQHALTSTVPDLPPPLLDDYDINDVPPPPDLVSDAPECDMPPPVGSGIIPPLIDPLRYIPVPMESSDTIPLPIEAVDVISHSSDNKDIIPAVICDDIPPPSMEEDVIPPPHLPPPLEEHDLPPVVENGGDGCGLLLCKVDPDDSITVTVNPMAEIDELASRVAKACRDDDDDLSPVLSPSIVATTDSSAGECGDQERTTV